MSAPAGSRRCALAAALALATLAGAGCGGDDDEETTDPRTSTSGEPPTRTVTVPPVTTPGRDATAPAGTAPSKPEARRPTTSPEDQPGGAGDEEPVRSEVVLTGRGGRIGPLLVKVPPFIAVRVVLRSGDGKPYVLRFGRRILRVGLKGARSSATLDGLRPGRRVVGVAVAGKVVIEASAEPGP